MRAEYDFSNAQKNPYAKILKKQITINIDNNTIDYFKAQSEQVGIPYQTLINLYLRVFSIVNCFNTIGTIIIYLDIVLFCVIGVYKQFIQVNSCVTLYWIVAV